MRWACCSLLLKLAFALCPAPAAAGNCFQSVLDRLTGSEAQLAREASTRAKPLLRADNRLRPPFPENTKNVLVELREPGNEPAYILGELRAEKSLDGYPVLVLEDSAGRTHWIDPETPRLRMHALQDEEASAHRAAFDSASGSRKPWVALDPSKLRKAVCPRLKALRAQPMYANIARHLESHPASARNWRHHFIHGSACLASIGAMFPVEERIYRYSDGHRKDDGAVGWVSRHHSNLTIGMFAMATLDQCLKTLEPRLAKYILKGALSIDAAANIHYEIDLGVERSPLTGDEITTDLADFSSGMAGIALYSYAAKALERATGIAWSRVCPK